MSVPLTVNGVTFNYPEVDDIEWGYNATNWAIAITNAILPKSGGNFFLTGDLNFGVAHYVIGKFRSPNANPAVTGTITLANGDSISWRNAANTGDLPLTVNSSNMISFNGIDLVDLSSSQTLSNKMFNGMNITGPLLVSGSAGTSSQVLVSQGPGLPPVWSSGAGLGSVTSVALATPSEFTVSGSPVTTSGTLTFSKANQAGNTVWAAPAGYTGQPTFRVLDYTDIPNLPWNKITTGKPTTLSGYGITDAVGISGVAVNNAINMANDSVVYYNAYDGLIEEVKMSVLAPAFINTITAIDGGVI